MIKAINEIAELHFVLWAILGSGAYYEKYLKLNFGVFGDFCRRYIGETKPLYFPILVAWFVTETKLEGPSVWTPLITLFYIWLYFSHKNSGDDSWKKRIEKLSEKVEVSEGKLVVVPTN